MEICGLEVSADQIIDSMDSCTMCNIVIHKNCNKKFKLINSNI